MTFEKKSILFIALLLLCSTAALGSTYSYTSTAVLNTSVAQGTQSLGKLVLTKNTYAPEARLLSDFGSYTWQQFDIITWQGAGTLKIGKDGIYEYPATGGQYALQTPGLYDYSLLSDPSQSGTITATAAEVPRVNVSIESAQIPVTASPQTLLLSGSEATIDFSATVPSGLSPGSYPIRIRLADSRGATDYNYTLTLQELLTWTLTSTDILNDTQIQAGEFKQFGTIRITNTGNKDFPINASFSGDGAAFFQTQASQNAFRGIAIDFNIMVRVPMMQPDGTYNATLVLAGGNYSVAMPMRITVHDTTSPEVVEIAIEGDTIYKMVKLTAKATDNIEAVSAKLNYDDEIYNMTKDQQLFFYNFTPTQNKNYFFQICAYDVVGNAGCKTTNITFNLLDIIEKPNAISMPAKKIGVWASVVLFNLTAEPPFPIRIRLYDFVTDLPLNASAGESPFANFYKMRVVDGDGVSHDFNAIGEEVEIAHAGQIMLEVWSSNISQYDGVLALNLSGIYAAEQPTAFRGKFMDYDLPQSFERNWYGNILQCSVFDSGDLNNSRYDCTISYPIITGLSELAIPTTQKDKNLEEERYNSTVHRYNRKITLYQLSFTLTVFLFLILFVFTIYKTSYEPVMRWRFKGRD